MGQDGWSGGLRFEVLGPVRALRDGEELPLGSPQQQGLLLSLLFRSGRQVSGGQLIDDLWGDEPPASAHGVIRTYVHRLRRVLGPDVLTSLGGGYLLVADHDGLDTARCETLVSRARMLRADGRPAEAATALRAALALWRGEPMSGVPGAYVRRRRREWEERRLAVLEARLEAEAEAGAGRGTVGGRWTGSVAELTALVEEHPLRERLSELLMLALYRSGRQADALEAYRAADRRLRTELGVAPGPGLRELHGRILAADRTLTVPAARPVAPTPPGPATGPAEADPAALLVPDQLPAAVADFTGREAESEALRAALREPGCVPVAAVAGMGGVGKTALAVQVAHDLAGEFPDGRLHLDLHGTDGRPTRPEEALAVFLRSFGVVGGAIPTSLAERAARYRSLLSGRRVLVLLDNARDAEQVRPLLPGSPGCAVLVTGRTRIGALPNARFTELAVLSADEAVTLLTRTVGGERVAAEPESACELVRLCGQLPLAVRILAARLACRPGWSIARLVEQLGGDRYRLDALRAGDLAVESSFRFGFDQLDAEQARAFRLLAVPEVPDLSAGEVAAVLDRPTAVAEELAESLVDCSMLEVTANPDRYRYHDLLRAFAQRLGHGGGPVSGDGRSGGDGAGAQAQAQTEGTAAEAEAERVGVLTRLVDHHHARVTAAPDAPPARAGGRAAVGGDYVAVGALVSQCAKLPRPVAGAAPALDRLAELLLGVCLSAESGRATRPLGHAANALLCSALEQGDRTAEARARLVLGRLLTEVGSASSALSELLRARDLCTAHGLPEPLLALAHGSLAACFVQLGRAEEAVAGFSAAVAVRERSGDRRALAAELLDLAGAFARQGRYDAAGRVIDQSLLVSHELADHALEARAREALGSIAHDLGRHDGAVSHRRAALALTDPADHRRTGRILLRLVESLRAAGRAPEAVEAAERALEALTLDGDHRGRGLALAALGDALAGGPAATDSPGAAGSPAAAGDRVSAGKRMSADDPGSADVRARARACWAEAHDILAPIGSPEAERLVPLLGQDHPTGLPRRRWPSWLPA
ncbi:AfsR/SARP family transcriptional regulator [Kitasatospora purpeofusca]|uniref:AfsR/SARP family transcriptional regulator n=1 Tax=Kitasatospora purpeofusca TaxID=67352 RepID=UPI002A5A89E3|nr:BTAD domain-containing putative transcriptional regulator [Kitasatospora purpeofusca]MDY0813636.1 BTAD domain-containing putative transcriptional regulator [Kitasatospora purpeofusca]